MKKLIASLALVASAFTGVAAVPAHAQFAPIQQIGVDNFGNAICNGPQGVAPCAVIMAWMQGGGMNQQMPASPFPQGGPFGPVGPMGVPTNIIPRDGQIVAEIGQACGGNPKCMAAAWATVEVQRCAQGVGVPGGCFGPNGEIMKVINRVVPQHLQPNVVLRNLDNDLRNGPGENNDLVGKNGFVCQTFFGGC